MKKIEITKEQSEMINRILDEKAAAIQKEQLIMFFLFKGHGINPGDVTEIKVNDTEMVIVLKSQE